MGTDERDLRGLAGARRTGLARELLAFLAESKKWWLLPIVIAVLLLGALVLLGGSAAAPFLYPSF